MKTDIAIGILAAIQICVESLPISSSTHEHSAATILELITTGLPGWYYDKGFEFLLHVPTLLMMSVYWGGRFCRALKAQSGSGVVRTSILLLLSTIITVISFPLMKFIGHYVPVWLGLIGTAVMLYHTRFFNSEIKEITYKDAILIGCMQSVALLPGISRMGATIFMGMWCGFSRYQAWWYSCALQIPLFGAAGLYGLYWAYSHAHYLSGPLFYFSIISLGISYFLLWLTEYLLLSNKLWYLSFYVVLLALYTFVMS